MLVASLIGILVFTGTKPKEQKLERSYRMGFSHIPPRQTIPDVIKTIDLFASRADAIIDHRDVPWKHLLDGGTVDAYLEKDVRGLFRYYQSKKLDLILMVEPFDGLDRKRESPALLVLGKSVADADVQKAYLTYVEALAKEYKPRYMGLASEVNLLLDTLGPKPRAAMIQMVEKAATRVHAVSPGTKVYVSFQADYAWGRLATKGEYKGCEEAFRAFPSMQALGISSYPYFGWDEPSQVPEDYISRIRGSRKLPVIVDEGGWSSVSVGEFRGSPEKQAAWIKKLCSMMDGCDGAFLGQLTFTDLEIANIPGADKTLLPLFAHNGLVDKDLNPKKALAVWDAQFARPRRD